MKLVLALILVLFTASNVGAVDYYFATSGDDAALVNTALTPWRTIDKLYNLGQNLNGLTLNCGDNVYLNRGNAWTANDSTDKIRLENKSCTSSSGIRYGTYGTGAKPIIDMAARTSDNALDIRNSAYITIENIEFRSGLTNQILGSNNVILSSNVFFNSREACLHVKRSAIGSPSTNVRVENNVINGCGQGGNNGEGIYLGIDSSQNGGVLDNTSNVTLIGNEITNNTHELIELKAGIVNTIIERNYLHDAVIGGGNPGGISVAGSVVNTTIRWNRINNITGTAGTGIYLKGSGTIHNNLIYSNSLVGLRVENLTGDALVRTAVRNTIYGNTGACTDFSPGVGVVAANNICRNNGSGNDAADPLFTNAGAGDFTISSLSSPAVDSGTTDGFPTNGALPTKGAFDPSRYAGGEVGLVNATTTILTFTNNVAPPLLPATGCTGFTRQEENPPATWNNLTVSSCERQGTNQIKLIHAAATTARAQRFSYAAGNVTDSMLIGNSLNQPLLAITNQAVTNNIVSGAGCSAVPATTDIYYVAINEPGASNTLCDGLWPTDQGGGSCPFKDFTSVAVREKLYKTAGDVSPTKDVTVKVRTGTYIIEPLELFVGEPVAGIYINANGADASEFVVLTNYNDEVVTLDGTCSLGIAECTIPGASGKTAVMMELYGDRVIVQGLRFVNVADRNAQIGASNTFFQCNHLTGGEDSVKNATAVGPVTIHSNTFTSMVQAVDATTAQDWTVSYNTFSNGGKGVGFKFNAQNNTISNNTFSNLTNEAISMGAGGSSNHADDYEAVNIVANNNLIQAAGTGVQVLWCNGCQVIDNRIISAGRGIYFGSDETTEQSGCNDGAGCLPTTGAVVTGNNFQAITGNTFITGKNPEMIVSITAGTNTYCVTAGSALFRYGTADLDFTQWKTATGTDATSSLTCPPIGGMPVDTQHLFQCYGLPLVSGALEKRPINATVNQRCKVVKNGSFIAAAQIKRTDAPGQTIALKARGRWNALAWFDIPNVFDTNNIRFSGVSNTNPAYPYAGFPMPCLDATGLTCDTGSLQRTADAIPNFTPLQDHAFVIAGMFDFDSDVSVGDVLSVCWQNQDGTDLGGACVPVEVEIINYSAGTGF